MLFATALAAAIAACGSLPAPAGGATATVSGTVVASPCRPVEQAGDPPCSAVGNVTVEVGSARALTDSHGVYSLQLAPGTYRIKVKAGDRERPATPDSVSVTSGAAITLNLSYDSGIR
jgi:type 1 fimbria pilin